MSRRLLLIFLLAGALLTVLAALPRHYFSEKPACFEDPALQGIPTGSGEYMDRVLAILTVSEPSDFRYFFETFESSGQDNYLVVNLRNGKHCFDARMLVDRWDKLEGMKRTNGLSYPEELYGLKWKIAERNGRREIIYLDMRDIID